MPTPTQLRRIYTALALALITAIAAVRLHVWNSPLLEVAAGGVFVGLVAAMVMVGGRVKETYSPNRAVA